MTTIVLAAYLILIGLVETSITNVPHVLLGVLALIAGVLILIGSWPEIRPKA